MITISDIIEATADECILHPNDLTGPRRDIAVTVPRFIAYKLAQDMTGKNLSEIGAAFGGRDHSTVRNGLARYDQWCEDFADEIANIRARLIPPFIRASHTEFTTCRT